MSHPDNEKAEDFPHGNTGENTVDHLRELCFLVKCDGALITHTPYSYTVKHNVHDLIFSKKMKIIFKLFNIYTFGSRSPPNSFSFLSKPTPIPHPHFPFIFNFSLTSFQHHLLPLPSNMELTESI